VDASTAGFDVVSGDREIIGLIPAGGQASRIAPLPCSKELYPVGYHTIEGLEGKRPRVASHYLLEKMRNAGIRKAYFILRNGKWDIPAYYGDGSLVDMHLGYLVLGLPFGIPYTLDQAYAFVCNATVAFGFPDLLFDSDAAFAHLLQEMARRDADVLLGLFPADQPEALDMVDVDASGLVQRIVLKPGQTHLKKTWGIALWNPGFTQFLHEYVASQKPSAAESPEPCIGEVFSAAMASGLRIEGMPVSDTPYLDIGTPDGLTKGVRSFARSNSVSGNQM
jgi:glucose-1-phosphate thymidylyltransferase